MRHKWPTLAVLIFCTLFCLKIDINGSQSRAQAAGTQLTGTIVADTFVASGVPTEPKGNSNAFWVGYDQGGGFNVQRTLLLFDVSGIPQNSRVISTELILELRARTQDDSGMDISVRRILPDSFPTSSGDFENTTWNSHSSFEFGNVIESKPVGTDFRAYTWNLQSLVQSMVNEGSPQQLALMLQGDETPGQRERSFWSKECNSDGCVAPQLIINFTAPPKDTPAPIDTPTPTATPTPTPAVLIRLNNDPKGEIELNEEITYTIDYYNNGSDRVTNVRIVAIVPENTTYVNESGGSHVDGFVVWNLGTLNTSVDAKNRGTVSYRVRRNSDSTTGSGTADPPPTATPISVPTATPTGETVPLGEENPFADLLVLFDELLNEVDGSDNSSPVSFESFWLSLIQDIELSDDEVETLPVDEEIFEEMIEIIITEYIDLLDEEGNVRGAALGMAAPKATPTIFNGGAFVYWTYDSPTIQHAQSNLVMNPQMDIYLPVFQN